MSRAIVPIAQLSRRIPEAGRIRIGKKNGNRPVAIGEFRFTSHDQVALEQIAGMYGGTVRPWSDPKAAEGQHEVITDATEIRVVLPPDPLGSSPIYEMWGGGGCERRCDGVTCEVMVKGPEGPEPTEVSCLCSANGEMSCKVTTRLCLVLPEVRFAGVWRLDTKSWNAAQELPGMVDMIQAAQAQGMPYATLSIRQRRSVVAGKTSKFMVPVLGTAVSIEQLTAGEGNLIALSAGHQPAVGAPAQQAITATAAESPRADKPPVDPPDPDDVEVDAELVVDLADGNRVEAIQARIDQLTQPQRKKLAEPWTVAGYPKLVSGDLTLEQADDIETWITELATEDAKVTADENGDPINPGATKARNSKMHAMVAEAWPTHDQAGRETRRKALIAQVGSTESSKDLTDSEWTDLFEALEAITAGTLELHLDGHGDWILRTAVMAS